MSERCAAASCGCRGTGDVAWMDGCRTNAPISVTTIELDGEESIGRLRLGVAGVWAEGAVLEIQIAEIDVAGQMG